LDWYPFYPALYRAATMHLSLVEDGAYRRLIDHYFETRAPLPDDDVALARIAGCGVQEWAAIAPKIRPFFAARGGRLHLSRCDTELDRQDRSMQVHSEISKKGAAARWNKTNGLDAGGIPSPLPPASRADAIGQDKTEQDKDPDRILERIGESEGILAKSNGTDPPTARRRASSRRNIIAEDWQIKPGDPLATYAVSCGLTADTIAIETEKFKNHHKAVGSLMADWPAAWRTWCRKWQTYQQRSGGSSRASSASAALSGTLYLKLQRAIQSGTTFVSDEERAFMEAYERQERGKLAVRP
jgi:uncharacterized protein YdaU (DUF1376 family)